MTGAHKVIEQVGSTQSVVVKSRRIAGRGGSCVLTINEDGSYEIGQVVFSLQPISPRLKQMHKWEHGYEEEWLTILIL